MKRLFICLLFTFSFFAFFASQADARSYSIDDVHIRVYISPDGNLLVNEMFTYSFTGTYKEVRRSIHNQHHQGVKDFEAYEIMQGEASLGFLDKNNLRQLEVTKNDLSYFAKLPVTNESKKIVYVYILENAVKSYNTYSDITVPFFGTDQNHDTDLNNVTIDFVFPEQVEPNQYHAFFHDEQGWVVQKTNEMIRFHTPVSKAKKLTETRILFPSTIMVQQQKGTEPMSLEKVLKEEEKWAESTNNSKSKAYSYILFVLSSLIGIAIIFLLLLPQRRLRRHGHPHDLLKYDPLYLYVIDRGGVKDSYSFLAGIFSLVEKGNVKVQTTATLIRLQTEAEAPNNTLSFSFHPTTRALSECERNLIDWLFTRKKKLNIRTFSLNNLYGATKKEKEAKKVHGYHRKQKRRKLYEDNWFSCVLEQLKEEHTLMNGKLYPIVTRTAMILVLLCTLFTYFIGAASGFRIILYLGIAAFLWKKTWKLLTRKKVITFFIITTLLGWFAIEVTTIIPAYLLFNIGVITLYVAFPQYFLSREAAEVKAEIRSFRKTIRSEGIPSNVQKDEIDKWMIRAILLNINKFTFNIKELKQQLDELTKIAPLTALVLHDEEPMQYLVKTWKWSKVSESSFWSSSSSGNGGGGDSGGSYSSDGGGGDSGGGAGAD